MASNVGQMVAAKPLTKNQEDIIRLANYGSFSDLYNKVLSARNDERVKNYVPLEERPGAQNTVIWESYGPAGLRDTSSGKSESEYSAEVGTASPSSYYGGSSYGAGVGGSGLTGPQRVDLTDILASYEKGAAAQEKAVRDSGESQRQSLLNSLKRFQAETTEARNQQRRAYNASRADLEGQAFMANRQALQNAAARGLGGSGLQQLAQLQNLINQSAATDKLAQSNTDVLKQLATAARNKEEDTNTSLLNVTKDVENKLANIAANNAQARAELQYKEGVRYEQARQAAEQFAAQLAAQNAAIANSRSDMVESADNLLGNILRQGQEAIKKVGTYGLLTGQGENAADAAKQAMYETLSEYNLPVSMSDTYAKQLYDYLDNKKNTALLK